MNPPLLPPDPKDAEQLRLLSIFHYVAAGLALAGVGFLVLHFLFFKTMLSDPEMFKDVKSGPQPRAFFEIFQVFYVVMAFFLMGYCVVNVLSARYLRLRRHRMFSIVVAGLNCLHMPIGTVLGVFTIIALCRDSVVAAYGNGGSVEKSGFQ